MLDYIPDNYEFPGYIAPESGIHGELRLTYRPMAHADVTAMYAALKGLDDSKAAEAVAKQIAARIRSWSLKGPNGEPVDHTAAVLLRLNTKLHDKVSALVQGYRKSDPDPDAVTPEKSGAQHLEESAKN